MTSEKTVGFVSLGCPKNLVDSEVMMGQLERQGWRVTPDAAAADVIVVNTCSFIQSAQQESVDAILEMTALKRNGRAQRLVVTGCLVERFGEKIRQEMPEVDAVLGTNELSRIGAACSSGAAHGLGGRARADPHWPGHHLLRRRPGPAPRVGEAA